MSHKYPKSSITKELLIDYLKENDDIVNIEDIDCFTYFNIYEDKDDTSPVNIVNIEHIHVHLRLLSGEIKSFVVLYKNLLGWLYRAPLNLI